MNVNLIISLAVISTLAMVLCCVESYRVGFQDGERARRP